MHRRIILLGLAAGVAGATSPVFAQTSPMAGMSEAEKQHDLHTAMVGMASLMMANEALEKAKHAKVKEFAKFEHAEQTTVAEILKSMAPDLSPPKPDEKTLAVIEKLKSLKSGDAFDKTFIMGQIDGHEKLKEIQETYLKEGKDQSHINVTKLILGMVNEHLTLLNDLHKTVG